MTLLFPKCVCVRVCVCVCVCVCACVCLLRAKRETILNKTWMSKIQHDLVTWHETKTMIPKHQKYQIAPKYQNTKKHQSGEIWTIHLLRIRLSLEKVKLFVITLI